MMTPLIEIRNLSKIRPEGRGYELRIPCLELCPGDFFALLGPSGSGKSTALDILALILRPDACEEFTLHLGGIDFSAKDAWMKGNIDSMADIRARYFGYVLQVGGLLPFLDVRGNILLSRRALGLEGDGPLEELAESLNISHLLSKRVDQISVGERQRTAIARALAHNPSLVLADEPTSALDPLTAADVMNLLVSTTRRQGAALIISSHDWDMVRAGGFGELHIDVRQSKPGEPILATLTPHTGPKVGEQK
ncbi:MAG: ATP-binding cassette domain-containing protein [Desulfovibrionaceae bacterium]|nr:ATP-binding cassette domain-containing protein [Desulfovibrionaceae bacterium]